MYKLPFLLLAAASFPAMAQARGDERLENCFADLPDADEDSMLLRTCPGESATIVVPGRRAADTGQPVTVIDRAEIESVQGPDITRILARAPGVAISRNGPLGSFTGVRLRGGEAEQVLVLVDGVRVADVASPGGGFDFGTLLPGSLERIEVLRVSNSVVWGSQALAGVIAVESRTLNGMGASVEAGTGNAIAANAAAGIGRDRRAAAIHASFARGDGFSTAAVGTEDDGYRQWNLGARGEYEIAPGWSAFGNLNHTDATVDIDGFPPPDYAFADTSERQDTTTWSGMAGLLFETAPTRISASFQMADTKRDSFDEDLGEAPQFGFEGRTKRAELRARQALGSGLALRTGGELEWSSFSSTFDAPQDQKSRAAYLQLEAAAGSADLAAGLRVDDYDSFGSATSLGADASVRLGGGWRLTAAFGEGFKAPTLYQLYSDYGNRTLLAERSTSYDSGIEYRQPGGTLFAALHAFRRDTRNLIEFTSCFGVTDGICTNRPFGTYENVAQARAQGIELEAAWQPAAMLQVRGVYAFTDAKNRVSGNDLPRRPQHLATLSADLDAGGPVLGADVRIGSHTFDDAANLVRLSGYEVVDLRASWPISEAVELFGRVENVFDASYQTAAGYGTQGRAGFVGVRLRP